ncbi:uncharacterized protein [Diadema setosum]|uniref:uncharacterized protein n=1 Tax=Diadema setosum TaxID=31175 RepID=UPI003B3B2EE1
MPQPVPSQSPPSTRKSTALVCQVIKELLNNEDYINMLNSVVSNAVDKAFTKLHSRVEVLEGQVHDLQNECDNKSHQITVLKKEISQQSDRIQNLVQGQLNLEQYSRRNCIRIFGVREATGECTDNILCDIAQSKLGITINPATDIDRSHRTGRKKPESASHSPRPIIVKMTSYKRKHQILTARRKLKGSGISIHEDLTKHNVDLLRKATHHQKVKNAWSSDGRIIVEIPASHGKTINKVIRSESDLARL